MPISLISKSILHFPLSSIFWKLSQPLGQDIQNSKQTYCRLSIIIFLWTSKGFISPEFFLNFLLNLYIYFTMVKKKIQIYSVKTTGNTFVSQKIEPVQFYSCPKAKLPPGRWELSIPQEQHFLKIFFPELKGGERII